MICSDVALFDSVAAFTHGVRTTTLDDQVEPTRTMLWHKSRALKALQAKLSADGEDKESLWTSNETILTTFYLMEAATRFGYGAEFRTHCLGLIRMMERRGEVSSGSLKDLFVAQAFGLVESTEMASELRHGIDHHNRRANMHSTNALALNLTLQQSQGDSQAGETSLTMMDTLPEGFAVLAALGTIGQELISLIDQLTGCMSREHLQRVDNVTEPAERQTRLIKRARLLEKQSQNPVERLACLGTIAFLTRRTSPTQMFPERAFIHKLQALGTQVASSKEVGLPYYCELRVWATMIIAELADTAGTVLKQDAAEVMNEMFLQECWVNDWDEMERVVKRYLWSAEELSAWKIYFARFRTPVSEIE